MALVAHPDAAARHGFDVGFDSYEEISSGPDAEEGGADGHLVVAGVERALTTVGDEPFFLWAHLFEPHSPYEATPELSRPFVGPYDGPVRGDGAWLNAYRTTDIRVDWKGWTHLRDLYDARVALADSLLGELLAILQWSPHAGRTVVVVTSAHGEALGEHGTVEHGDTVYGEQIDIPLVIHLPGGTARRVDAPATLTDVAPTLLALASVAVPETMEGIDMLGSIADVERSIFARSADALPMLRLSRGSMCLVVDLAARSRELYDLAVDPGQTTDIHRKRPATTALLYRELTRAAWSKDETTEEVAVLKAALRRRLRRL
jgi:arylsulfatase A-like enzyme